MKTSDGFFCLIRSFFYFKLNHNQILQGFFYNVDINFLQEKFLYTFLRILFSLYLMSPVHRALFMIEMQNFDIYDIKYIIVLIPNNGKVSKIILTFLLLYPFISTMTYSSQSYIKKSLVSVTKKASQKNKIRVPSDAVANFSY